MHHSQQAPHPVPSAAPVENNRKGSIQTLEAEVQSDMNHHCRFASTKFSAGVIENVTGKVQRANHWMKTVTVMMEKYSAPKEDDCNIARKLALQLTYVMLCHKVEAIASVLNNDANAQTTRKEEHDWDEKRDKLAKQWNGERAAKRGQVVRSNNK